MAILSHVPTSNTWGIWATLCPYQTLVLTERLLFIIVVYQGWSNTRAATICRLLMTREVAYLFVYFDRMNLLSGGMSAQIVFTTF